MTDDATETKAEARRRRLGPAGVAAAKAVAAAAPPWTDAQKRAIAAILSQREVVDDGGVAQSAPLEEAS